MDSTSTIATRSTGWAHAQQLARPLQRGSDAVPALQVRWARHADEVRAAQRLRHQVFVGEMGASLCPPPGTPPGHDIDRFDDFCEHLLVQAPVGQRNDSPLLVGTYRVLTPAGARRAGGLYSETEFDLAPLRALRLRAVELGRSCVHPDWRSGGVILALWAALGGFMERHRLDTMIGCASVSMRDGGHAAANLWRCWRETHLVEAALRVRPLLALPVDERAHDSEVEPPPLIKGYLRCGAKVLGPPAWDAEFDTADFALLMRLADLAPRYRMHFLGR